MFQRIYDILVEFLGESKQGYYDSDCFQYQFNCPACAEDKGVESDNKHNLEINFQIGKFHCWSCGDTNGMKGKISHLISRYGNQTLLQEYRKEIASIKRNKLYDINLFKDEEIVLEDTSISLPSTYTPIILNKCSDKRIVDYLKKRNITQDIIDWYNIGYTTWSEENFLLRNRIIIPSYDCGGNLNFWTGRDFTNKPNKLKYFNLAANKKQIIFNESHIQWDADIILCEGPFDMLSCPYNVIPLLGKSLSKDSILFQTLYEKSNGHIILYLDGDAKDNVKNIYRMLNQGRLRNKIRYVPISEDLDPNEVFVKYGKRGVLNLLKQNRKFTELELLK